MKHGFKGGSTSIDDNKRPSKSHDDTHNHSRSNSRYKLNSSRVQAGQLKHDRPKGDDNANSDSNSDNHHNDHNNHSSRGGR